MFDLSASYSLGKISWLVFSDNEILSGSGLINVRLCCLSLFYVYCKMNIIGIWIVVLCPLALHRLAVNLISKRSFETVNAAVFGSTELNL